MKIMTCPVNGPRNITEFVSAGEVRAMPDPGRCSDAEWADYLFLEDNSAGIVHEWWLHAPTNTWFIATRNRATDEVIATQLVDAFFAGRTEQAP